MKTVSFKLPDALANKLTHEIHKRGIKKSLLLRELLDEYFADQPKEHRGSFLDLAQDLCGYASGPKDLATHKKHLQGYGE